MITKQERFKKYLIGNYNTYKDLDANMSAKMAKLGWRGFAGTIQFKLGQCEKYIAWPGEEDWYYDIKTIIRELNNE